jgi:tRNA isopentenyl-2-thiomethyl-A-37 hydroxylase MiaE
MLIELKKKRLLKKFLDVLIPKNYGMPSFSEAVNFNSFLVLLKKSLSNQEINNLLRSIKNKQAELEDASVLNEISNPIANNLIEQYFSSKKVVKKLKKLKVY